MASALPKLSVETVVVCDDVRHEKTGKTILVGVYNHNLLLDEFPSPGAFNLWIQLRVEGKVPRAKKGKMSIGVRLLRDKKEFLRGDVGIQYDINKSKILAFTFTTPILEFKKPCQLRIGLKLPGKKRWQTVKVIEIEKMESSD